MLSKFYKITSVEKKIFYTCFQQATRISFTGFSSRWKYRLEVSVGLLAHRLLVGVGVCQYDKYETNVLPFRIYNKSLQEP